jgi:hypothetical protein
MKFSARSSLVSLALVATCSQAAAPDPSLVGCWRAVKIVLHSQDGSKAQDTSGRCTLRFQEDRLESTCSTRSGEETTTYEYRIARPGFYLATMVGSTFSTQLMGSTREYEYHVDGDRLVTVTHPGAGRVELEGARTPCQ